MSTLPKNPITVTDVEVNQLSIMTNIWSLLNSIQTLKYTIQNPSETNPNDTLTPLQHAQLAVIENAVITFQALLNLQIWEKIHQKMMALR